MKQQEAITAFNRLVSKVTRLGILKDRCMVLRPKDGLRCLLRVGHDGKHVVDPSLGLEGNK